ncbi:hypothetical protein BS50DRAFT_568393 [Corynespora cassiicola Philippines]|uniref:Glutathione S-transferase UstS-like C-terminal domain-containing protein n=1 Tax=Corynespora cassiicola Philippines TaxID=1448308 RepID=A0A2T2P533_CORCC|nr:hypothetical protein BS50DRAFT_568393 [Corynespora cassiicola Philippines]
MDYSSPAIRYEDGSYGMDSWKIAHELEKRYPEPSLHLDDPIVIQVRDHIGKIMGPLTGYILPRVPTHILGPASAEYFDTTREKMFGKPLAQVAQETATEQAWKDVEEPVRQIAEILKKNSGPFFLGKTVSYADFIFVGYLRFLKAADEKVFDRFVAFDPAFSAIYDASKPWLEKDN